MRYSEKFVSQLADAVARRALSFSCRQSKVARRLVLLLQSQGYVSGYRISAAARFSTLEVFLTPDAVLGKPRATRVERFSTSSRSVHVSCHQWGLYLRPGRRVIVSTPTGGLLPGEAAYRAHLGGTLLFAIT